MIGLNGGTANVNCPSSSASTTKNINPTETLQVDFVTGANLTAGKCLAKEEIQYGSHIETINAGRVKRINQVTPF